MNEKRASKPTLRAHGDIEAAAFQRRMRMVVGAAWVIPPFFGISFLLFVVEFFTLGQLGKILLTAPLPVFVVATGILSDVYFRRYCEPICGYLNALKEGTPPREVTDRALRAARRFPLHFWVAFLLTLALAPAAVNWSAYIAYGFSPSVVDWFRIELVALIVSIIVGLPIFFMSIDLLGLAFREETLVRPQVTVRAKVFLIAALVPLLIDTMLVQYFWTATGHFTGGTVLVWLVLELMAVAGAALFVRSFHQSLSPLNAAFHAEHVEDPDLDALKPASTDELGILSARFRHLLQEAAAQRDLLALRNRVLSWGNRAVNLAEAIEHLVAEAQSQIGAHDVILALTREGEELVVVAHGGRYQPDSNLRIPASTALPGRRATELEQVIYVPDVRAPGMPPNPVADALGCHAVVLAPLVLEGRLLGLLAGSFIEGQPKPSERALLAFETVAQEAASVIQRLQLETQLLHSQRMEGVGRLAGGVAHDFNNILTVLMGNAYFILDHAGDDGVLKDEAEQLILQVERASELTGQLLAFSRKQLLRPQVLDPSLVIGDLAKMLGRLISSQIELTLDLKSEGWIRADRGQLEQVVVNLVVNARDAIGDDGSISVSTFDDADAGVVCMVVEDDGPGVPRELQKTIFEPYFTTKDEGKGTGLGLSTVYGIVTQSHGTIGVTDGEKGGARFEIRFPRLSPEEVERQSASKDVEEPKAEASKTVLVVDDNEALGGTLRRAFRYAGFNCLSAINAEDALRVVKEHAGRIDLLVTDVVMPGMKGPALARALRELQPGIAVILMSGYAADSAGDVEDLDCKVLSKPFSPGTLLAEAREAISQRKADRS